MPIYTPSIRISSSPVRNPSLKKTDQTPTADGRVRIGPDTVRPAAASQPRAAKWRRGSPVRRRRPGPARPTRGPPRPAVSPPPPPTSAAATSGAGGRRRHGPPRPRPEFVAASPRAAAPTPLRPAAISGGRGSATARRRRPGHRTPPPPAAVPAFAGVASGGAPRPGCYSARTLDLRSKTEG